MNNEWTPIEFRAEEVAEAEAAGIDAVHAVATSEVPAAIVRGACSEDQCRALLERLFARKLFMGYEEHGKNLTGKSPIERFDIGASLGNFGGDSEEFFARAGETNALYADLFEGVLNPVELLYGYLARLANGKQVNVAHEPDGRLYGPAIFRCHMPRWGYPPHISTRSATGSSESTTRCIVSSINSAAFCSCSRRRRRTATGIRSSTSVRGRGRSRT